MIRTDAEFELTKVTNSRISEIDFENIQFGKYFSDHMFEMEYRDGAWSGKRLRPYENIPFSPATSAFHYGQAIFEGLKAYKNLEGEVFLFRPTDNAKRLNASAERLCMPPVDEDLFVQAIVDLVKLDSNWIPDRPGSSLYIRPFMIATDDFIGVKASDTYRFMIFTCPVGAYYTEPLNVKIETMYSRACEGGIGRTKAAGNYAASLYPAKKAKQQGYHQLIWTDAKEHKYIEESGTMNIMFLMGKDLITPTTSGTILPGITRHSVLSIARDWGYNVHEDSVHVEKLIAALENNEVSEAFGTGTAATIARIQKIGYKGKDYDLPAFTENDFSIKVGNYLEDLKRGKVADKYGWITKVN